MFFVRSLLLVSLMSSLNPCGGGEEPPPPPPGPDTGTGNDGGSPDAAMDVGMAPEIDPFGGFASNRSDGSGVPGMDSDPMTGELAAAADCFVPEPASTTPCESSCGAVTLCSVGSAGLCAPFEQQLEIDSLRCAAEEGVGCLDALTTFGDPPAFVLNDALHPGGDDATQGGAKLAEDLPTGTTAFAIRAEFQAPACSAPPCLESAALALMPSGTVFPEGSLRDRVTPLLSFGIAGVPAQLLITVQGEVVFRGDFSGGLVELRTNPSGQVSVSEGDSMWSSAFEFESEMDLVLLGRNSNPTASDRGAALKSFTVTGGSCDRVDGFAPLRRLEAVEGAIRVEQSSLVDVELVEADGRLFVLSTADGVLRAYPFVDGGLSARGELEVAGGEGLREPEVVQTNEGLKLYGLVGEQLVVASLTRGEDGFVVGERTDVRIGPGLLGEALNIGPPAIAFVDGTYVMVAVSQAGKPRLLALHSSDGFAFTLGVVEDEDLMIQRLTLDQDLVEQGLTPQGRPSLVRQGQIFHLFVEAREGTRSAIYDLKSETFLEWSLAGSGPVVSATGAMQRLGVGRPRALITSSSEGREGTLQLLVDARLPNENVVALTSRFALTPSPQP